MTQPDFHQDEKASTEPTLRENLAKGCAVDAFFFIVLLVLSTFISDFGVAWVITLGVVIGLWALWHILNRRNKDAASEK